MFYLKLLQIRPFDADHLCQQLGFQTVFCDREIEEGRLRLQFWLIVRIGQLCVQEEAEVLVKLTLFVSNPDTPGGDRTDIQELPWNQDGHQSAIPTPRAAHVSGPQDQAVQGFSAALGFPEVKKDWNYPPEPLCTDLSSHAKRWYQQSSPNNYIH